MVQRLQLLVDHIGVEMKQDLTYIDCNRIATGDSTDILSFCFLLNMFLDTHTHTRSVQSTRERLGSNSSDGSSGSFPDSLSEVGSSGSISAASSDAGDVGSGSVSSGIGDLGSGVSGSEEYYSSRSRSASEASSSASAAEKHPRVPAEIREVLRQRRRRTQQQQQQARPQSARRGAGSARNALKKKKKKTKVTAGGKKKKTKPPKIFKLRKSETRCVGLHTITECDCVYHVVK